MVGPARVHRRPPRVPDARPGAGANHVMSMVKGGVPTYVLSIVVLSWLIVLVSGVHTTWEVRAAQSPGPRASGTGLDQEEMVPEASMQQGSAIPSRRPWNETRNWVYWLDGPRLDQIAASNYELAVIDYSQDGSKDGEFSARQIEALRHASCERRVLAYLSIGQAEDYRFYWQDAWPQSRPGWIVGPDPDWEGAYWVRYWDPAWKSLVYQYLDRILAQGFDGIYLDRIDAFEEQYARGHERDMVDFVLAIARYARARSPLGDDFGIVVQNAANLGARHADYVAEVTGIAQEETYVAATNRATSPTERDQTEADLNLFRQASRGRLVLTVDYADTPGLVRDAYQRSSAAGYVPYVTDVGLDRLRTNAAHEPTCQAFGNGGA